MSELLAVFWERLTKEFAQSSPLDLIFKLIAAIILAAIVYIVQKVVRRVSTWVWKTIPLWWNCCGKLARARTAVDERGPGLWLTIKVNPHPQGSSNA